MYDISPKDRLVLDPCIERVKDNIVKQTKDDPRGRDVVWEHLKQETLALAGMCAILANLIIDPKSEVKKLRGWLIVILDGLFMNLSRGLKIAMALPEPNAHQKSGFRQFYFKTSETAALLEILPNTGQKFPEDFFDAVEKIMNIAHKNPKNIAFVELCNYFFAELGSRVIMDTYGQDFNLEWIQFLAYFWTRVAEDLYKIVAAPLANEKKEENGDYPSFIKMREMLAVSTKS